MTAHLLIELFTEELPPKALSKLSEAFSGAIHAYLVEQGLAATDSVVERFASPRRLAVRVSDVISQASPRTVEVKGPSVKVGLDAAGAPTQALIKWAERQGADVKLLSRANDGKQECFFWRTTLPGKTLAACIDEMLSAALAALPIPKLMQYQLADGVTSVSFVRPAHRLIALHGDQIVPASVLGLRSDRLTEGHRFLCDSTLSIPDALAYERLLESQGEVIASFEQRKQRIARALDEKARALKASLGQSGQVEALLDEVTALVEWPEVYVGAFEETFLEVPQECLILTMRTNQKYFPLFDPSGRLLPQFLIVSNMRVADPSAIIDGNQRVVRPRLADARFFYEQDRRTPLAERVAQLGSVVYHAKLGTQAERVERVRAIAGSIAALAGESSSFLDRAALLAKADLPTGMVGEFPELQGVMGRYYALHDGEPPEVAQAIVEHYQPRFAGDALPQSRCGTLLALADKLETLAGLFGVGQSPTGDKDPFALRRHALGVIRILIEKPLALPLPALIDSAFSAFGERVKPAAPELQTFIFERLAGYLRDLGFSAQETAAVVDLRPADLSRIPQRLAAVRAFSALPEAQALAAANKRIGNLLRKADSPISPAVEDQLLADGAERALASVLVSLEPELHARMAVHDYESALKLLAQARQPVDRFFDEVMVMADDPAVRRNRLALLTKLHALMNGVADISRLSVS
jgi:glycyl-tRNA synthetase beta chain